jgi:hypothetical protein
MSQYQLDHSGTMIIHHLPGGMTRQIPMDMTNSFYVEFLAWDAIPGNDPDPADPPPVDPPWDADLATINSFIAAYPAMLTHLATIQTEMDGIKGRADTLAGLTTWSGLTLAATTARLQAVMPPLGQDLGTIAVEVKAIAAGLDDMLRALAALKRRTSGD